ncbi:MAG TPA: cytochrome c peroxidase [Kofleriaceae bacterium]|jgi:cytochrome c peroxidase|nr:cytochrome c peroxidase [Kofleriaceae bacterium]
MILCAVAACSRADPPIGASPPPTRTSSPAVAPPAPVAMRPRELSAAAEAGKQLFFDKALSASGKVACSTCHDPDHAYGPPNDLAVQLAGPQGISSGVRAVPSLRYKEFTPGYADLLDNADGFSPPGPGGGFTWDGRADSLGEQAQIPLLSPFEMANATPADAVARLRASGSAAAFARAFGAAALADADTAFAKIQLALQSFQLEDPSFHPYSSKYDRHLFHQAGGEFTPAEERGFQVFVDQKTANCSGCHYAHASKDDGAPPQFTDFSFEAIGVPRNPRIPANRDRNHVDLGLCGPLRDDHARFPEFCGLFKTPSLRNVATRRALFHNGVIHSLDQAVRFYNTRDTRPELWYPTVGGRARPRPDASFPRYGLITTQYVGGTVQKLDDLPATYHNNLDKQMPLDGRAAGSEPPMTEQQVTDLICFLRTLTDADQAPATAVPPGACTT